MLVWYAEKFVAGLKRLGSSLISSTVIQQALISLDHLVNTTLCLVTSSSKGSTETSHNPCQRHLFSRRDFMLTILIVRTS